MRQRRRNKNSKSSFSYSRKNDDVLPFNNPMTDDEDSWENYENYGFYGGDPRGYVGNNVLTYTPPPAKKEIDPIKKLMLEKMMVAHYIEDIPKDCKKSVIYVFQGNGVYEKRINKLGNFVTCIFEANIPGLKSDMEEGWELNVPKIPASLLGTAISFFRSIQNKYSSEVFLQFYYDFKDESYTIHCPKQTVSGASVRYINDEIFEDPNKILVFEIHSHSTMGAFFSSTDDNDEKADRFYGVVGKVNDFFPEVKMRLSVGGRTSDIEVADIFDLDEEMYHIENFPEDWNNRIEENKNSFAKNIVNTGHFLNENLEDKFDSDNFIMDKGSFVKDDRDTGYFLQEGTKLWRVENAKKVWYEEDGEVYEQDDDGEWYETDRIEPKNKKKAERIKVDSNPLNHRGKVF